MGLPESGFGQAKSPNRLRPGPRIGGRTKRACPRQERRSNRRREPRPRATCRSRGRAACSPGRHARGLPPRSPREREVAGLRRCRCGIPTDRRRRTPGSRPEPGLRARTRGPPLDRARSWSRSGTRASELPAAPIPNGPSARRAPKPSRRTRSRRKMS